MSEAVADKHIQTVVIGTSLEEGSDAVVRAGAALARAAGARVHLVHAVQMPSSYLGGTGPEAAEALLIAEQGRLRQEVGEQIERVGIEGGADVGRTLRSGVPHRVLPEVAVEIGAELLVVGASEGRFQRLLGSAADRVLRRSSIPVLVVRGEMPAAPRRRCSRRWTCRRSRPRRSRRAWAALRAGGGSAPRGGGSFRARRDPAPGGAAVHPRADRPLRRGGAGAFCQPACRRRAGQVKRKVRTGKTAGGDLRGDRGKPGPTCAARHPRRRRASTAS